MVDAVHKPRPRCLCVVASALLLALVCCFVFVFGLLVAVRNYGSLIDAAVVANDTEANGPDKEGYFVDRRNDAHYAISTSPLFVQELYDDIVAWSENNLDVEQADGVLVEALKTEGKRALTEEGFCFALKSLKIPINEVTEVELILALNFNRVPRPPHKYRVYVNRIVVDAAGDGAANGTIRSGVERLVSSMPLPHLYTFRGSFLKFNITALLISDFLSGTTKICFDAFITSQRADRPMGVFGKRYVNALVLANDCSRNPLLIFYSYRTNISKLSQEPSPEKTNKNKKKKRDVNFFAEPEATESDECHLQPWYVELRQIMVQKTIIPEGFYANYCVGPCTDRSCVDDHANASSNAIIRHLFLQKNQSNPVNLPDALCAPSRLLPLSVLYADGDSFIIRRMEKMIVVSCRCV